MSLTSSKADGWPGGFVILKALFCWGWLGRLALELATYLLYRSLSRLASANP